MAERRSALLAEAGRIADRLERLATKMDRELMPETFMVEGALQALRRVQHAEER